MGLGAFLQSSFLQTLCCCFPSRHTRPCQVPRPSSGGKQPTMAPISLDFAAVPKGIANNPEVSIAELDPMSPHLDALESLTIPKLSTIREQSELTATSRPRFGRSVSVAFEGKGTVHDFLRFLKNERFRHMPHDGSSWDKILKWADNIGGVVLLSVGVLSEFMLNSEEATRLICDSCTSLIQVRGQMQNLIL